jgi:hypothetical protein
VRIASGPARMPQLAASRAAAGAELSGACAPRNAPQRPPATAAVPLVAADTAADRFAKLVRLCRSSMRCYLS